MPQPPLIIKTNTLQLTTVKVIGTIIQPAGENVTLETTEEIVEAQGDTRLRTLLTDDVHGTDSSTLILANGDGDIPQSRALSYLDSPNTTVQNWFGGWG